MRPTICLVSVLALMAAAPGVMAQTPAPVAVAADAAPIRTYTAAEFYQTRNYGMSSPAGLGFSANGRSILISSDETGVFNAWALPVAGGAAQHINDRGHAGPELFPRR
jgi:hypothetical protein